MIKFDLLNLAALASCKGGTTTSSNLHSAFFFFYSYNAMHFPTIFHLSLHSFSPSYSPPPIWWGHQSLSSTSSLLTICCIHLEGLKHKHLLDTDGTRAATSQTHPDDLSSAGIRHTCKYKWGELLLPPLLSNVVNKRASPSSSFLPEIPSYTLTRAAAHAQVFHWTLAFVPLRLVGANDFSGAEVPAQIPPTTGYSSQSRTDWAGLTARTASGGG